MGRGQRKLTDQLVPQLICEGMWLEQATLGRVIFSACFAQALISSICRFSLHVSFYVSRSSCQVLLHRSYFTVCRLLSLPSIRTFSVYSFPSGEWSFGLLTSPFSLQPRLLIPLLSSSQAILWVLCSKTDFQSSSYIHLHISPHEFLNFHLYFSSLSPMLFPTHRLSWGQSVLEQNVCSRLLSICGHQLLTRQSSGNTFRDSL